MLDKSHERTHWDWIAGTSSNLLSIGERNPLVEEGLAEVDAIERSVDACQYRRQ